ncbi:unnamed protein product [Triticum turgidum subsp. durum]|uniref:Non-reducing end beta-L-arabinofuranosidase-like GH127 catalytic domain-containing protein n=1 Tax=Triticum turgidum subsp. durum TaxID=4567 RepID=A0A9R1C3B5_TRITD|nr:unnamed protein product [Triticum turgidum subsp. durum]
MAPAPPLVTATATALALVLLLSCVAVAKECTNVPTQLSSHTVRARLQSTPGAEEWRWRELFHDHLNPTDESAWMDLLPLAGSTTAAAAAEEFDWAMLYRTLKGGVGSSAAQAGASPSSSSSFLVEASLHDVRLDPGDEVYGRAQQTNLEYLLLLDVDRLVWSFRRQAGLPAAGAPYGGWEGAVVELRGHFVGIT